MQRKQEQQPWRGRAGHNTNTLEWLEKARGQCATWPNRVLSDHALISLLDSLPELAKSDEATFQASMKVLETLTPDQAWARALKHRLVMVKRAAQGGAGRRLSGDGFALAERKDSWRARRDGDGSWVMHDGRTLDRFVSDGSLARAEAWRAAAALPGLASIEMPTKHLDGEVWASAFAGAAAWLEGDHEALVAARGRGDSWRLALRRVRCVGLRGLFDPLSNLVVVDPRHPDTLVHELAHWVLGHKTGIGAVEAERQVDELLAKTGGTQWCNNGSGN